MHFKETGGGRQDIAPPPIGSQSLPLKVKPFSPREAGQGIPVHTHRNVHQIPVRLPLPLPGRIPKTGASAMVGVALHKGLPGSDS